MTNIPKISSFIKSCGLDPSRYYNREYSYKHFPNALEKYSQWRIENPSNLEDVLSSIPNIESSDDALSTEREIGLALLLDEDALSVSLYKDRAFLLGLDDKQKGLHSIFLLRDLVLNIPAEKKVYDYRYTVKPWLYDISCPDITIFSKHEERIRDYYKLSEQEINDYYSETVKQYSIQEAENNKYFTAFVPGTNSTQISPEMNILLKYKVERSVPAQKVLEEMAVKLAGLAVKTEVGSKERMKYAEFEKLIQPYARITGFIDKATKSTWEPLNTLIEDVRKLHYEIECTRSVIWLNNADEVIEGLDGIEKAGNYKLGIRTDKNYQELEQKLNKMQEDLNKVWN